jgi:cysteine desulfurase
MLNWLSPKTKRVYLDYAAASPVSEAVAQAMAPYWQTDFANPSSIHLEGVRARRAVDEARLQLARMLHIKPEHVVFTGNGTESNNLMLFGLVEALVRSGRSYKDMEIISTAIEHPSIAEALSLLAQKGVCIKTAAVSAEGIVDTQSIHDLLSEKTVLVTVSYVQSEIGVVQPIAAIARAVRAYERTHHQRIVVHTDAAQAPLWLPCQLDSLQVDAISLDAGKCYGPKGVGVLAWHNNLTLAPHLYGGGQEFGLRSGTEHTPLIVGAATALVGAQERYKEVAERVTVVRDTALQELLTIPGLVLNGSATHRVANNINVSIEGVNAEFAVISLDQAGFAIATKSACSGATGGGSTVIKAISGDNERADTSLRITLGTSTTAGEVHSFIEALKFHVAKVRHHQQSLTQQ